MATMNISLPDPLRTFVEQQVSEGSYGTVSEYFRELIRADQQRRAEKRLEALLLEGVNSGNPIQVTPAYIEQKRKKLLARHAPAKARKGKKA